MVLKAFATTTKLISAFPGWSKPEPETGYIWFDAPLEIGGVTEAGLFLHGGCYLNIPDRNVTFELAARGLNGRRRIVVPRVCWRSLRGGHTNPRNVGPRELRGLRVGPTHYHSFNANWVDSEGRMRRGDLPLAEEIAEQLQSFEDARSYAGNVFRINNMSVVERPAWEYDLFHDGQDDK